MAEAGPNRDETSEALVAATGGYELLKKRLTDDGEALWQKAQALNAARIKEFGRREQALLLRTRARTENSCVARDIVQIGDLLLFGYNVFIGLRRETAVKDVFALYRLGHSGNDHVAGGDELQVVSLSGSFLDDPRFVSDFKELYAYYKQATLLQLRTINDKLLAAFQIGAQLHDVRVFRWHIERDGSVRYVDNRGERDMALPRSHDFEWTAATRDDHVAGKHPHVNVLDTVFVEALGGDLTVKIENNTETGLGIYSEPVEDHNQSLADAEIAYAKLGLLVLLSVRPYREMLTRYLVYNSRTQTVERIDAIGGSCVQLPEDQGIVFPGGYYLQSGELKRFDLPVGLVAGLRFKRQIRSPNGEDVLYVFYQPGDGRYALFTYNIIDKALSAPIISNGYARFEDGRILVFQVDEMEPTRLHPMQMWQTPFATDEHASAQPAVAGFFGRVGNAELVRGISDLTAIARAVREQAPTRAAYEDLIRQCTRVSDAYFWLEGDAAGNVAADLRRIRDGARATLAEFEKVDRMRRDAGRALDQAAGEQRALMTDIASALWRRPDDFISALVRLREQRGRLQLLRELRYADAARIATMDADLQAEQQRVGERALSFLADEHAFDAHHATLDKLIVDLDSATTSTALAAILAALDALATGLDLLTEQIGTLPGGDAVTRTAILDRVSVVYAAINKLRAHTRQKRMSLGAAEAASEFGAQFKLFGQAVENALEFADTPQKCDESLTRLLAQLEELEGRFADQESFLGDIATKREAVYEAMSARRQALVDARQRRAQAVSDAATRILDGVPRRMSQLADVATVHSYFSSDALIAKLRGLISDLRNLGADILADDLETRLTTARDQALRAVRDKIELVAEDGNALRLGRHTFTINRQPLDLTLVPRGDGMACQITGTDYSEPLADPELDALKAFWLQTFVSETDSLCRSEYLAGTLLQAALRGRGPIAWSELVALAATGDDGHPALLEHVRQAAAPRYAEGYLKGVHDEDAARLLSTLAGMQSSAGLLAWGPTERALAALFWEHGSVDQDNLQRRARAALHMDQHFGASDALIRLESDWANSLHHFAQEFDPDLTGAFEGSTGLATLCSGAAAYLVRQVAELESGWVTSSAGDDLRSALDRAWGTNKGAHSWHGDLNAAAPSQRWHLARDWARAFASARAPEALAWVDDAAASLAVTLPRRRVNVTLDKTVVGLLGEHPRIAGGTIALNLNDFWSRFRHHVEHVVPAFTQLQRLRMELVEREKKRLGLHQFRTKPLSTFVRNRLIDEVYLPLVGDNLAKQLGAAGAAARSDRMGLLLLISPPGYGKTTLMEYVADRLGLVFVRINCPALGHGVTSVDPANASNSAARQELEKLNLGLAMGSNVMLYLDDIQHTSAEFLQKFIALADATRRIEGVANGQPCTYDVRGKRFALVMAGNPYTESGDVFKIPDMLANRADIYNLGDVLSGREALFALSYLENCLTSNPALLPLASRDPKDVHLLVQLAEGREVAASEFSHGYSALELDELKSLFQRLFRARDLLLKVNQAYIESAAQQDAYREEPPFKLQGSYRNMTKLAGKINALMRHEELDALLRDHYRGEAQTLTTGAEENLLKLAQLLGTPTTREAERWQEIRDEYVRRRKLGGDDADAGTRIASTLLDVARAVDGLRPAPDSTSATESESQRLAEAMLQIAITYRQLIMPLVAATERRLDLDKSIHEQVERVGEQLDRLVQRASKPAAPKKPGP